MERGENHSNYKLLYKKVDQIQNWFTFSSYIILKNDCQIKNPSEYLLFTYLLTEISQENDKFEKVKIKNDHITVSLLLTFTYNFT